ncbi:S8 family serine peptidase [Arenimonas oryziterrae]|uniref:PKD domain-containing protein n=1 Tax=Arenimonas oryziterrae DSM 21050 = YC6267 TaxID=1121015 RepID=A0A091AYN5_9GAMM|nr:S8 family serine peptidase [Arenimonas oryziterrae]KFN44531.1 hypothetical protein N789_00560 [Arenimonas oryziterrae DSM 21050 = YC6267]
MKKTLPCLPLLLAAFAANAVYAPPTLACRDGGGTEPTMVKRYVVRFRAPSTSATTDAQQAQTLSQFTAGFGARAQWVRRTAGGANVIRFLGSDPDAVAQALEQLAQRSDVAYVVEDKLVSAAVVPNDPMYSQLWGLTATPSGISAPSAWNRGTGTGAVIAVLDTGITAHPDLNANRLAGGYDFVSTQTSGNDGNGRDADASDPGDYYTLNCEMISSSWHGTHVSGTAAAVGNNAIGVVGVAYGAKILPVRVLGGGGGTMADVADGIIWAAGGAVPGVPLNPTPATVINMSLAGFSSCGPVEQEAIDFAINAGIPVVVAAGNWNTDASQFSPGNCNGVITVGATTNTGARASFSNYGPLVEISAPGVDILSTRNSGTTYPATPTYSLLSGTSMATPQVAGVVALMQSIYPRTPRQITQILQLTAKPLPVGCAPGCGAGIVNADAAATAAATWPAVLFHPERTSACSSSVVMYTTNNTSVDPDDAIVSVLWDYGDGRTSTDWSPTIKYPNASPNTRRITLTVTDAAGHSFSDAIDVDTHFSCTL